MHTLETYYEYIGKWTVKQLENGGIKFLSGKTALVEARKVLVDQYDLYKYLEETFGEEETVALDFILSENEYRNVINKAYKKWLEPYDEKQINLFE